MVPCQLSILQQTTDPILNFHFYDFFLSFKISAFKVCTLTPPLCTYYKLYDNAHFLYRYYLGHSTA